MLVSNSFDLWQKDIFFSAAEEVQRSADIMESAYRTWVRARREGLIPQHLDELERELQMALSTAKWQLEEFERAVHRSYRNRDDDVTITRHRQFVSVIEDQISNAETALQEAFNVEGKKPFRWVHLDAKECDELALFLSGTPSRGIQDESIKQLGVAVNKSFKKKIIHKDHSGLDSEVTSQTQVSNQERSSKEVITSNEVTDCHQTGNNQRTWCSPDKDAFEIVIDINDTLNDALTEEGSKPFFSRSSCKDNPKTKKGVLSHKQSKTISRMKQHLRGSPRSQRQQVSPGLPVHSLRFVLLFMLTVFLVVPFLLYST